MPDLKTPSEEFRRVLVGALGVALLIFHVPVLRYFTHAQFHMDVWEMILRGSSLTNFLQRELWNVLGGEDRVRPIVHSVMFLWGHYVSLDGRGLSGLLWACVLGLHGLEVLFLYRIGFRLETALLTAFTMLFSRSVLATCYAHQYNDVALASLFTVWALALCSRDRPAAGWKVFALGLLGILCHEIGAVAGFLLLLSNVYRLGGGWKGAFLRSDWWVLQGLCCLYLGLRALGHAEMVGSEKVFSNLTVLWDYCLRLVTGGGVVFVLYALSRLPRCRPDLTTLLRCVVIVAWPLCAYSIFLLNVRYQSLNYGMLVMLLPAAALIEPAVSWATRLDGVWPARGAALAFVCLLCSWDIASALDANNRLSGPLLEAISEHLAQASERQAGDIWIGEEGRHSGVWGRSYVEEEIALYGPGESLALIALHPARQLLAHVVDLKTLAYLRPASHDLVLVVGKDPVANRYSVWHWSGAASWLTKLHGDPQSVKPQLEIGVRPVLPPETEAAVDRFWEEYRIGSSLKSRIAAYADVLRSRGSLTDEPSWLEIVRAACGLFPGTDPFEELRRPPRHLPQKAASQ